jgi:hypothetical protein
MAGAAWALLAWGVAVWLQLHGDLERGDRLP